MKYMIVGGLAGVGMASILCFIATLVFVILTDGSVCIVRPDWLSKLLGAG